MKLKDFQNKANETILETCKNEEYLTLGLASEVGEVAGVVKKFIRGDMDEDTLQDRLTSEVGDILWYISMIMKYVIEDDFTPEIDRLVAKEPSESLTTREIYSMIKACSVLVANIEVKHRVGMMEQIYRIMQDLVKICDLELAMDVVITKLFARKDAGTLHGDGEGVRDGQG